MAKQFSDEEEREIELALEVRRRHAKEIRKQQEEEDQQRPKYDASKPETNRRKIEKDRRAQAAPAPAKTRKRLFAA